MTADSSGRPEAPEESAAPGGADVAAGERVLVCSGRADVRATLLRAFSGLEPAPAVLAVATPEAEAADGRFETVDLPPTLAVVDLATWTPEAARERLGAAVPMVALLEGEAAERLVDALSAGAQPPNPAELGLRWRRHLEGAEGPALVLEEGEGGRLSIVFPSEVRYLRPAVRRVVDASRLLGWPCDRDRFRLRAAVSEAVTNAVLYGNREDPMSRVEVSAEMRPEEIRVTVADEGEGFDPDAVPDPRRPGRIGLSRGRGLFLLRSLMDEVSYNEVGNEVTLVLRRDDGRA